MEGDVETEKRLENEIGHNKSLSLAHRNSKILIEENESKLNMKA